MAVAHVAVNSLQWAADQAAMLEKQLELRLVNNIDCVQVAQDAAHRTQMELTDSLVMLRITPQVHIQLAYVPVAALAEEAAVGRPLVVTTIAVQ